MTEPPIPHCPAEAVAGAVEAMLGTMAVALALVSAGRRVNLEGLDGEISAICAATVALPPEEGQALLPAVESLLESVDALTIALRSTPDTRA